MIERIQSGLQDAERLLVVVGVARPQVQVVVIGFEGALREEAVPDRGEVVLHRHVRRRDQFEDEGARDARQEYEAEFYGRAGGGVDPPDGGGGAGGEGGEVAAGAEGAVSGGGWKGGVGGANLRFGYLVGCAWRIMGASVEGREAGAGEWCRGAE